MNEEKIQTGLRLPESQHDRVVSLASQLNMSRNSLMCLAVSIGLKVLSGEDYRSLFRSE